jgi:hypothetical protein
MMALDLGPFGVFDDYTDRQLEGAWQMYRDQVMADGTLGTRAWGWWHFEASEKRPQGGPAETLRLIELVCSRMTSARRSVPRARGG